MFLHYVREQCQLGFHNLQFPLNLFNQMMSLVARPLIFDFNRLLSAMLKLKRLNPHSTVISLYSRLELSGTRPNLHSMGILANCYCYVGRVDFGVSLLAKSLKLGYPFDCNTVIFNTLINGYIDNNQLPEAVKLWDVAVLKLGVRPNRITYGTMVKGLCGIGDNAGALDLIRRLNSSSSSCKPDIIIYSTLIDSLCKDKLITEGLNLFSTMKTEGIKPDVFTYTSLIRGLFNLGRKGEVKEMLFEMMESNIALDVTTHNMLVDMYCKGGRADEAQAILPIMIKRGLTPDVVTYTALLDGYCFCGQMDKARDLMDLMVKSQCQPNVLTFSSLIHGYVKHKSIDKAINIFQKMCEHGIAPDVVVYFILVDGLREAGRVQDAENLISDVLSRGLVPSLEAYNTLSKANIKRVY